MPEAQKVAKAQLKAIGLLPENAEEIIHDILTASENTRAKVIDELLEDLSGDIFYHRNF